MLYQVSAPAKRASSSTSSPASGDCDVRRGYYLRRRREFGPRHWWYPPLKVAFEWVLGLAMLAMALPVILVLAWKVRRSSPGPAFYKQVRLGRYGKPYTIYKLRTMADNCEATTGAVWSSGTNDARVTRLGRFLRDTHLDELPQLFNVLKGQMGLIGPRPERPELVDPIERLVPRYRDRMMALPGVTGLAQMRLPADTDLVGVRKKVAHDLYYVREMSPWLDFRISLSTGFYFLGAICQAVCGVLVKSYGEAAVNDPEAAELLADDLPAELRVSAS